MQQIKRGKFYRKSHGLTSCFCQQKLLFLMKLSCLPWVGLLLTTNFWCVSSSVWKCCTIEWFVVQYLSLFSKNVFIFNWRIITLQYCVGFFHTSIWIIHRYTYVHPLLNLPPHLPLHPTPIGCLDILFGLLSHLFVSQVLYPL